MCKNTFRKQQGFYIGLASLWKNATRRALYRRSYQNAELLNERKYLKKRGYHLVDIRDASGKNGKPEWTATFMRGQKDQRMILDASEKSFSSAWKQLLKKGFRLSDIETRRTSKGQVWSAILNKSKSKYGHFRGLTFKQLKKKVSKLKAKGLALVDVETYKTKQGKRLFAGVWLEGKGKFEDVKIQQLSKAIGKHIKAGYEPIDIERYSGKGNTQWVAIVSKKVKRRIPSMSVDLNKNFGDILNKIADNPKLHLVDFD